MVTAAKKLRNLINRKGTIMAPCAYDAMSAKLIELSGFKMVGTTGNGIHGHYMAVPDNGTMTMTEMADVYRRMSHAVDIPVMADAEAGYGNSINVIRTVQTFEETGLAGIFLEDQHVPTNCPFVSEPKLVSVETMVGKIRAAIAARKDPDFVICARSDAPFEEAVERAQAYLEAGADMIKIVPKTRKELELLPQRVNAPLHIGFVSGKAMHQGMTLSDACQLGYKIVTFPQMLYYAAIKNQLAALESLKENGFDEAFQDHMIDMDTYNKIVDTEKFARYRKEYVKE